MSSEKNIAKFKSLQSSECHIHTHTLFFLKLITILGNRQSQCYYYSHLIMGTRGRVPKFNWIHHCSECFAVSLYHHYNQEGGIYKDINCETKQAHGPRSHSSCRSWDPGPYLFSSIPVFQPPGNSAPSVLPNKKHFGDGHSKWFPLISVHHRNSQSIDWEPLSFWDAFRGLVKPQFFTTIRSY